jgi:hypothetical protein
VRAELRATKDTFSYRRGVRLGEYIIRTMDTVKVHCRLFGRESFSLTGVRFRSAALRETTARAPRGSGTTWTTKGPNAFRRSGYVSFCRWHRTEPGNELLGAADAERRPADGQRVGQQVGQLGTEVTRRNLNVQPTLVVRPGYRFFVRVEKDILFNGPYSPMTAEGDTGRRLGREAIGGQEDNTGKEIGREENSQGQPRGAAVDG